jgi:hypothetical protein
VLAGWFVLTVAVGLTIKGANEDTHIVNYYKTTNSASMTFGQDSKHYQNRSRWSIAASALDMFSIIFNLYYSIVLLVLRKNPPNSFASTPPLKRRPLGKSLPSQTRRTTLSPITPYQER